MDYEKPLTTESVARRERGRCREAELLLEQGNKGEEDGGQEIQGGLSRMDSKIG
jgi:hypothetical protein